METEYIIRPKERRRSFGWAALKTTPAYAPPRPLACSNNYHRSSTVNERFQLSTAEPCIEHYDIKCHGVEDYYHERHVCLYGRMNLISRFRSYNSLFLPLCRLFVGCFVDSRASLRWASAMRMYYAYFHFFSKLFDPKNCFHDDILKKVIKLTKYRSPPVVPSTKRSSKSDLLLSRRDGWPVVSRRQGQGTPHPHNTYIDRRPFHGYNKDIILATSPKKSQHPTKKIFIWRCAEHIS